MPTSRPAASQFWSEPTRISIAAWAALGTLLAVLLTLPIATADPPTGEKSQASQAGPIATHPLAQRVISVGLTVNDMDRELAFFTELLDFQLNSDIEVAGDAWEHLQGVFGARMRICTLHLGDESIELTQYLAPAGRPIPVDSRSNDGWFQHIAIITSDMDAAYARLRANHVRHASTGPQTLPSWNANAGGIRAFYFRDPEDHVLEILQFPADKGRAKWHESDRLFLGIDHTAIVVRDTEQSLAFYRDRLGMIIAGEAENYGTEQEHLNNVFGARLRITSLRFPGDSERVGPSIELLEYLAPRDGRPYPADTRGNDLWHWQVNLDTPEATTAGTTLRDPLIRWISPGVVEPAPGPGGFVAGFQVRDPDGHAIRFLQCPEETNTARLETRP